MNTLSSDTKSWIDRCEALDAEAHGLSDQVLRQNATIRELMEALTRLLASAPEIAEATEDQLCFAANEPGDPDLNEQAAAVLQARAALAKAGVTP